jgi:phosphoribosylformylglycinamidine synthase I
MKKVAIIQFPGSNCEYETLESLLSVHINADIVSWTTSEELLGEYAAFVLPGGFSFQDRVRAGVVSSKLPLMKSLLKYASEGRPILGICNGCQILAESGLVPDTKSTHQIEMALAPNMKNNEFYGFVCDWVYVRINNPGQNIFTKYFDENDVFPIQINHGEGNFRFSDEDRVFGENITYLQYCDKNGVINAKSNPNGAWLNIAGLSNRQGNVLAMMPHPERATFNYQIPAYLDHSCAEIKRNNPVQVEGPWQKLFLALADYLKQD